MTDQMPLNWVQGQGWGPGGRAADSLEMRVPDSSCASTPVLPQHTQPRTHSHLPTGSPVSVPPPGPQGVVSPALSPTPLPPPRMWVSRLSPVGHCGGQGMLASHLPLAAVCMLTPYRAPACLPQDLSGGPVCWESQPRLGTLAWHLSGGGPWSLAEVRDWRGLGRWAPHW